MSVFTKQFDDPETAFVAARRSALLRQQGLTTPTAEAEGPRVRFARIDGLSGLRLAQVTPESWLLPLAHLHACALPGLAPIDPLRRIRPRGGLLTEPGLRDVFARLARVAPAGGSLLHGDFHLGQVIGDRQGEYWMIDLDDLCIGPPEADLGNLIANLATQQLLPGSFASRLHDWRDRVLMAWTRLAPPADPERVDHFAALALLRRHLKLRAQGRPDFEAEILRWITPVACRISPSGSAAYPE